MTDDRFAEHVREVFDAYHEPVDPGALARLQAELGHAPTLASDRAPARRQRGGRGGRWRVLAALAALAVAVGGGWLATRPEPSEPAVAQAVAPGDASQGERRPGSEANQTPSPQPSAPRGGGSGAESRADSEAQAGPQQPAGARPSRSPAGRADGAGALVAARKPVDQESPPESVAAQELRAAAVPVPADSLGQDALAPLPPTVAASGGPAWRMEPTPSPPLAVRAEAADRSGVRVVVATTSAFAGGRRAEGGGVSAGLARDWRVGRGVTVSGGAAASYTRLTLGPQGVTAAQAFDAVERDPGGSVDVTTRSTLTTLALEIPLDLAVDLVRTPRGRLSASMGLTSALYLAQTFEDQGQRVVGQPFTGASGDSRLALSSMPFEARETAGVGRVDLARQLNLALGLATAGRQPLAVDVYARLPLGGLTSRDLALTTLGLRLRVPLP